MRERFNSIVLLGPTGSGKTPLGAMCAERGWRGERCVHFDFGDNLRQVVARNEPDAAITATDIVFLRHVLQTGALLDDKDFSLAERILDSFLRREGADARTWVMMNGLPRHLGQAQALVDRLDVRHLLVLKCSPGVVLDRIARNTGGDRTHRTDDDAQAIERKLEIYSQRTQPLVDYYTRAGAEPHVLEVTAEATAGDLWNRFLRNNLTADGDFTEWPRTQ